MKFFQKINALITQYDDTHNFTCDICGREVFGGERVCRACMPTLPLNNGAICPFCGRRVGEAGACLDCKEKPLGADKARSLFVHEGEAASLVLRYKRGAKYFVRTFATLALPLVEAEFPDAEVFTYVPMTKKAERKRGFNQSRLLCECLARYCKRESAQVFVKKKETPPQKTLGRADREKNLEGCFALADRKSVKGKRFLIVDDVLTTGATASELAALLRKAGAAAVYVFTVSSVPRKDPFGKKD